MYTQDTLILNRTKKNKRKLKFNLKFNTLVKIEENITIKNIAQKVSKAQGDEDEDEDKYALI